MLTAIRRAISRTVSIRMRAAWAEARQHPCKVCRHISLDWRFRYIKKGDGIFDFYCKKHYEEVRK